MKIRGMVVLLAMFVAGCQVAPISPPRETYTQLGDEVIAGMRDVLAKEGIEALGSRGFVRPTADELARLISGNTLRVAKSYSFYASDNKIAIKDASLGQELKSSGTWQIRESNLCHSVQEGHEFCTGTFFHEKEILCWPGIHRLGDQPDETDYLRECAILAGNKVK